MVTISPTRPERADALRLWFEVTLFPTRPERAEAHSPGQRPGLFWAVACRPVRAKALYITRSFKVKDLTIKT